MKQVTYCDSNVLGNPAQEFRTLWSSSSTRFQYFIPRITGSSWSCCSTNTRRCSMIKCRSVASPQWYSKRDRTKNANLPSICIVIAMFCVLKTASPFTLATLLTKDTMSWIPVSSPFPREFIICIVWAHCCVTRTVGSAYGLFDCPSFIRQASRDTLMNNFEMTLVVLDFLCEAPGRVTLEYLLQRIVKSCCLS